MYCGVIIAMSHQSKVPMMQISLQNIDKLYHLIEYGILALLVYVAWSYKKKRILAFLIIFSISDEIHQYFIPGRNCSFFDLITDVTAILGVYIIFRYKDRKKALLL